MAKPTEQTGQSPRGTTVSRCTCANAWQDREYGSNMRVHNARKGGWRCTVCSREGS